jgi:hypothetical protein
VTVTGFEPAAPLPGDPAAAVGGAAGAPAWLVDTPVVGVVVAPMVDCGSLEHAPSTPTTNREPNTVAFLIQNLSKPSGHTL